MSGTPPPFRMGATMADPDPSLSNLMAGGGILVALSAPFALAWTGYSWLMGRIDERTSLAIERALHEVRAAREAAMKEARAEMFAHMDAQIAGLEDRMREHGAASKAQSAAILAALDDIRKRLGGDRE